MFNISRAVSTEDHEYLTVKEVANILGVTPKYVYDNLVNNPESKFPIIALPCKERKMYRIPKKNFHSWEQKQLQKCS